jgi:2-iminobutanoate/2-iminopropanoate deaminase
MVEKEVIRSDKAPTPLGPYSQAIKVGNTLYVSGQVGIDPATGKVVEGGIKAQTRQILENLKHILAEAGMGLENVVKVTVFITRPEDFRPMNEVYAEYFREKPPARSLAVAKMASEQFLIELDAIAQA